MMTLGSSLKRSVMERLRLSGHGAPTKYGLHQHTAWKLSVKIGDLVTMNTPLTPGPYEVGLIQKIVAAGQFPPGNNPRLVYHILWPDGGISNQYDNEIVLVSR